MTTQVLGEFFTVVTRKIPSVLSAGDAVSQIRSHLSLWTVIELTGILVLDAAIGVRDHKMSFWDAQIWAAASANRIPVVLSEDISGYTRLTVLPFVIEHGFCARGAQPPCQGLSGYTLSTVLPLIMQHGPCARGAQPPCQGLCFQSYW